MTNENSFALVTEKTQLFEQEIDTYVSAPRKKDYYQRVFDLLTSEDVKTVLDVGTASGDFLYFMPDSIRGTGIDKSDELIAIAKKTRAKANLTFECADILTFFGTEKFDCVTVLGTMLSFLDFRPLLDFCLSLKPRLIVLNDYFNPHGVDIQLGSRYANETDKPFYFGYNIVSLQTMQTYLEGKGVAYSFEPYIPQTLLQKNELHPLYNFHVKLDDELVLTNGTGLTLHGYNLIIHP
jgi:hypothetical protein